MTEEIKQPLPAHHTEIVEESKALGFTMLSDQLTGSLLRTLAASKPSGKFLDMGTGTGLSASWILDGMDDQSTLITIDNDSKFQDVAKKYLGNDKRVEIILTDGGEWVAKNSNRKFDYIFADTWHGKFLLLEEVLSMLNKGGLYIIDDMLPQPNWPDGHHEKVVNLINHLETQTDLVLTKQVWSTGIVVAVKK